MASIAGCEFLRRHVVQRAVWAHLVVIDSPAFDGFPQCSFRHSPRNLPWKLSIYPFSIGRLGVMQCSVTLVS